MFKIALQVMLLLSLVACASKIQKAARDVKYKAYEKIGYEKRDLFKSEIKNVKEDQEDSSEAFKDALTNLKEIYAFDGGNLENQYESLNESYLDAREKSNNLKARVTKVNTVAQDLFTEWETEISQIKTAEYQTKSRAQLAETKKKYNGLYKQLKKSESKMDPVLVKLQDQVLFLKHNLNAKAIAGLKVESDKIQTDIKSLLSEIEQSSKEADEFIKTL